MSNGNSIAKVLGDFGNAIAPSGSVSSQLGETVSNMAGNEAERQFLSDAMGADVAGNYALDPKFVMQAIQMKSDLEQAKSQMKSQKIMDKYRAVKTAKAVEGKKKVPIKVGDKTVNISPGQYAQTKLQQRKLKRLENKQLPTPEEWAKLSDEEKQPYLEYQKVFGGGTSLGQQIAELTAKQEARHRTKQRLEVGSLESINKKVGTFSDNEVNRFAAKNEISNSDARRALALRSELADVQSAYQDIYDRVFIGQQGNKTYFWGEKSDGTREKISEVNTKAIGSK